MKTSLQKDQRGLAQVVTVLIAVVVIAVVGVAGWKVMENKKEPAAAKTTVGKSVNESCMKVYDDKDLCYAAATSADFEKVAYKATATSTDAQGKTGTVTLESDGKGNSSFTTASDGQSFGTITIGKTVYTKTAGSETWVKYTTSTDTPGTTDPSNDLKTSFSDAETPADKRIQYKKLGKEKCGNADCLKYQVIDPANPDTTTYVWFNTKDYRLQRMSTKNADGSTDFVITYTAVKISVPSPVSDSSATTPGMPSQAELDALQQRMQEAGGGY